MNKKQKEKIIKACNYLYNRYCFKNGVALFEPTIKGIAEQSAERGYAPSISRTPMPISLRSKSKEFKESLKDKSLSKITNFLIDNFGDSNGYNMDNTYQLMNDIRNLYHEEGINDYTYGNAQKIVSIAMKYFFLMLHINGFINIFDEASNPFRGYNYSVVDREILKNEDNIRFHNNRKNRYVSWSREDNFDDFKNFQVNLYEIYGNEYSNLYFYEILHWRQ